MGVDGLRDAVDQDSWPLIALIAACWAEYPGCVTDVDGEYPELRAPARYYQSQGGALWVVPEGHWISASVGLLPADDGRSVELVKLYVARHRRGQGLGEALIGWIEDQARDRGAESIQLWSDSRFHDAHRLYLRCGFTATGEARDLGDLSRTTELGFHKTIPCPLSVVQQHPAGTESQPRQPNR